MHAQHHLTEAEEYAKEHPGAYPAAARSRAATRPATSSSEMLGLKINQMVVVDLYGFQQLIDAMGGLDINVKLSGYGTKLTIGGQHDAYGRIFGEQGLLRARVGSTSTATTPSGTPAPARPTATPTGRGASAASCRRSSSRSTPRRWSRSYPEIAKILKQRIYTDIQAKNLPAFVDLVERVQKSKITSVALTSTEGVHSGNPDYDLIRTLVKKAIAAPAPAATPSTTPSTPKPCSTRTSRRRPPARRRRPTSSAEPTPRAA